MYLLSLHSRPPQILPISLAENILSPPLHLPPLTYPSGLSIHFTSSRKLHSIELPDRLALSIKYSQILAITNYSCLFLSSSSYQPVGF